MYLMKLYQTYPSLPSQNKRHLSYLPVRSRFHSFSFPFILSLSAYSIISGYKGVQICPISSTITLFSILFSFTVKLSLLLPKVVPTSFLYFLCVFQSTPIFSPKHPTKTLKPRGPLASQSLDHVNMF